MASCIQGHVVTQGRPGIVVYRDKLLHRETVASCIQGHVVTQGRPWLVVYRGTLLHRGDRG